MDVRGWLQHTVDRASPNSEHSERLSPPRAPPESPDEDVKRRRKYRRKRKRARDSYSSIRAQSSPYDDRQLSDNDISSVEADLARSQSARSTNSGQTSNKVSVDGSVRGPYDRRARRKTRTDRYEPNRSKTKNTRSEKPKKVSKRTTQKDKRGGDGTRAHDLMHSFQMKNGPKKKRLTLPARNELGIFKHGRASHQTSGGRSGLPDLAFNEMKFLQKAQPKEQEQSSGGSPHESHKAGARKNEDERISAYFQTSKRSSKHVLNRHPYRNRPVIHHKLAADQTSMTKPDKSPAKSLEPIPISSSGSQQPPRLSSDHADRRAQNRSDDSSRCLSWSISAADSALVSLPSPASNLVREDNQNLGDVSKSNDCVYPTAKEDDHAGQPQRLGHDVGDLDSARTLRTHAIPSRQANAPSDQAKRSVHRVNDFQATSETPKHRTSDILRIGAGKSLTPDPIKSRHSGRAGSTVDKENMDPICSTPSSGVLRLAFKNLDGYPLMEHEAHLMRRQYIHHSAPQTKRLAAGIVESSPRNFARWSRIAPLQSDRSNVQVRKIPRRGLHRSPDLTAMSPTMTATRRPDSTRSFEAKFGSHRPSSAALQQDLDRYRSDVEPGLSLSVHPVGTSRGPCDPDTHLGPDRWQRTILAYDSRCNGDVARRLNHCHRNRDGHLGVRSDVHEEDSAEALLAWDKSQATQDLDANCSGSPLHDHDLDLQLRESNVQLQNAYLVDWERAFDVQSDCRQSVDDRQPAPQELEGFWRSQKFY